MKTLRNLYVVLALSCVAGGTTAQDTQDRAAQGAAQERPQPPAQGAERAPANPAAEESAPGAGVENDSVTTSEEIQADEEVTFPVDI